MDLSKLFYEFLVLCQTKLVWPRYQSLLKLLHWTLLISIQCLGCVVPLAMFVWSLFLSHRVWTFGQNTWGSEKNLPHSSHPEWFYTSFHQKYLELGIHNITTTASNLALQIWIDRVGKTRRRHRHVCAIFQACCAIFCHASTLFWILLWILTYKMDK